MATDGESLELDLVAASLRADMTDLGTFVEGLAIKLEEMIPGRVKITRARSSFRGPKLVRQISIELAGERLELVRGERDVIETKCAKVSGGIVLKTEPIGTDDWLEALGRGLTAEAARSANTRQALERLLLN
ncbi:MAG: hypothetical protein ACYDHH_24355 [Solirubrobacteraceae bacterium]